MGEEKGKKGGNSGEKKKDAAAAAALQPIVLKVELHCAGCAAKVKKAIKNFPGVESVLPDMAANKVTVTGPADAAMLKERIEAKTKKAVEIISAGSAPKKDAAKEKKDGGEKKADAADKPKEEKKQAAEEKKPKEETVTLKIRLHCEGCIDRIRRRIYKIKGVKDVVVDAAKDMVKVTGTMDAAALPAYLKEKLNRSVEVVPAKKDGGGGGGDKKDDKKDAKKDDKKDEKKEKGGDGDKKKDAAGEEKKDKEKAAPATAAAAAMAPPVADASMYQMPPYGYFAYPNGPAGYYPNAGVNANYYGNANVNHYAPYGYRDMVQAPQMFSDENPNACSIM